MSSYLHSYGRSAGSIRFKKRKSRFTFSEVQLLLSGVKKNRHILVGKFNKGVSGDLKKRTWASLTARINEISECHREIIEIIKKWSDLKCDTKRKVAAMRASGFSAARIAQDLSPVESMVYQILQMAMPADRFSLMTNHFPDEDEDSQDAPEMPQDTLPMTNGLRCARTSKGGDLGVPVDAMYNNDLAVPLTDLSCEPPVTEDQGMQIGEAGYQSDQSSASFHPPRAKKPQVKLEAQQQQTSSNSTAHPGTSSQSTPSRPPPLPAPVDQDSLQEHLAKSASLSLQEQQATTLLIGTLSRSLESLSESMQQLVQTQKEFAQGSLRLQRDTLHVLRDFSSSALSLLQDRANGRP